LPRTKIAISPISVALRAQPVGGDRHQRRADHHAGGIAGDQQAGRRDRHAEIGGDLRQQAHDDEFGGADAERGGGERDERRGHGCVSFAMWFRGVVDWRREIAGRACCGAVTGVTGQGKAAARAHRNAD
jgi:hypothetical protein